MTYERTLDALADGTRRRILSLLKENPLSVGELADALPVSQPAVSQHLRILREASLVRVESDGVRRINHLDTEGLAPLGAYITSFWDGPLEAFRASFEGETALDRESRQGPPIRSGVLQKEEKG